MYIICRRQWRITLRYSILRHTILGDNNVQYKYIVNIMNILYRSIYYYRLDIVYSLIFAPDLFITR